MFSHSDRDYMQQAIDLAKRGLFTASPNPRVGCVLVKNHQIIGRGWHHRAGLDHAEVDALKDCTRNNGGVDPRGATVYVTLEPCSIYGKTPPCSEALLEAGVSRVVVGSTDPNPKVSSVKLLQDAGIDVATGCEEQDCKDLNRGFFSRMQRKRPWVRVKLAMSLDGRTALANGASQWITGDEARADVQVWRAQADCILTGIGTVLHDNPQLTVRLTQPQYAMHGHGDLIQPLVAITDSSLQTPPESALFNASRSVVIYTGDNIDGGDSVGADVISCDDGQGKVDLKRMLENLAGREINEVHVEAGAALSASLLEAHLVDELLVYVAPHLLGCDARALFALSGIENMDQRVELEFEEVVPIGTDLRLRLRRSPDLPSTAF